MLPANAAILGLQCEARAAGQIARDTGLDLAADDDDPHPALVVLERGRVELRLRGEGERFKPLCIDLTGIDGTSGPGRSLRQPIARAVGLSPGDPYRPLIFDATAGYGADAWLLASLGCRITAVERSPVVALLLADALRRAGTVNRPVAERIRVRYGDSLRELESIARRPDVVYLDPMFPPRRGSAKPRKPMRMLQRIVGPDADADQLFDAARRAARRRVVVKRPLRAEPLAPDPVASHKGKAHRYDVYRGEGGEGAR